MLLAGFIAPRYVTNTQRVGLAMLRVAKEGFAKMLLENHDINEAARD